MSFSEVSLFSLYSWASRLLKTPDLFLKLLFPRNSYFVSSYLSVSFLLFQLLDFLDSLLQDPLIFMKTHEILRS